MQPSPDTWAYPEATQKRVENTDMRWNLERAFSEYGLDFENTLEDGALENCILSHQRDWDLILLNAYEDMSSPYDTIAKVVTTAFTKLIMQWLSPNNWVLDRHNKDITVWLHKIAKLLISKGSWQEPILERLERYAISWERIPKYQRDWNAMLSTLDSFLQPYWDVVLKRLLRQTQLKTAGTINSSVTHIPNKQLDLLPAENKDMVH